MSCEGAAQQQTDVPMVAEDSKNKSSQSSSDVEVIPDQPEIQIDENMQKAIDKELEKIREENKLDPKPTDQNVNPLLQQEIIDIDNSQEAKPVPEAPKKTPEQEEQERKELLEKRQKMLQQLTDDANGDDFNDWEEKPEVVQNNETQDV